MNAVRFALAIGVSVLGIGRAAAWELNLEVKEMWGQSGPRIVSGGVPLLQGQAKEAGDLRLAVRNKDGHLVAVPAQFRVLARWWRGDNSIRWVLVDFQTDIQAGGSRTFWLTNERLPAPPPKPRSSVIASAYE